MEFIAATNNPGKMAEMRRILERMGHTVRSQREAGVTLEPEENGTTFAENARIKARAICEAAGTATIADDSGLCVDALDGAPGVYSARYCGRHGDDAANNAKLLEAMKDVADIDRTARFVCSLAFVSNQISTSAVGFCEGRIGREPHGENGFGYDPLFIPDEVGVPGGGGTAENTQGRSYAELSAAEKDAISHRGRAMERMEAELARFLADGSVIGMTCGNACITVADKAEG